MFWPIRQRKCPLFRRGVMFYLCYVYLFTYAGVHYDLHMRWCLCRLSVKRRVQLVEQEQLILPGTHKFTACFHGFSGIQSLVSCVEFCKSLFVFWSLCCLSVLIYGFWLPVGIFKIVLTPPLVIGMHIRSHGCDQ